MFVRYGQTIFWLHVFHLKKSLFSQISYRLNSIIIYRYIYILKLQFEYCVSERNLLL